MIMFFLLGGKLMYALVFPLFLVILSNSEQPQLKPFLVPTQWCLPTNL